MDRKEMLAKLAPCGLYCGKCLAFAGGPIQEHALALAELLGENFGAYAERFSHVEPAFAHFDQFKELLDYLGKGECRGCREGGCLFKTCKVAACTQDHNVDFCFQCKDFPCETHGLPERLAFIWKLNNERMKEKGVDTFCQVQSTKARYP